MLPNSDFNDLLILAFCATVASLGKTEKQIPSFAPGGFSNFWNDCVQVLATSHYPSSLSIYVVHPFAAWLGNCFGIQSVVVVTDGGPASKQSLPVQPWSWPCFCHLIWAGQWMLEKGFDSHCNLIFQMSAGWAQPEMQAGNNAPKPIFQTFNLER